MNEKINNIIEAFFEIKNKIGNEKIIYILILLIFLILIFNYFSRRKILKYIKNMPTVKINSEIQENINNLDNKIKNHEIYNQESTLNFKQMKQELNNVLKTETVKYNPYEDMGVGGNQSFSTIFIDKNGNGKILTSLYSRERSRVMIKIIKNYIPEQELSPEEKTLLEKTRQ